MIKYSSGVWTTFLQFILVQQPHNDCVCSRGGCLSWRTRTIFLATWVLIVLNATSSLSGSFSVPQCQVLVLSLLNFASPFVTDSCIYSVLISLFSHCITVFTHCIVCCCCCVGVFFTSCFSLAMPFLRFVPCAFNSCLWNSSHQIAVCICCHLVYRQKEWH